jgi:hypothetical protein
MDKFQEKYRIPSARLQNWDYGWAAAYFVTICTANRECDFGEVKNGEIRLTNIGVLPDVFWYEIRNHTKNIEMDVFVIMPNQVHGILILQGNENKINVETRHALSLQTKQSDASNQSEQAIGQQRFQNQGKNTLSSIIGSYKSAVSKHTHRLGYNYTWQSSFHDHIIRDKESHYNIQQYIINNPLNWENDKFFK